MIGIVAHTSRGPQAHTLMEQTGAAFMSMDNGTHGCEGNHRRVWEHLKGTQWSVVLEDDALPVDDFRNQLDLALQNAPTPIVSLYLGRRRPQHAQTAIHIATEQADKIDANYILSTHLLHAVGIAIRTELIPAMLAHTTTSRRPWDYAIGAWALQDQHLISYTWPSLVEHADTPTVLRHPDKMERPPGRTAWRTGTRQQWTPTTVTMPSF